jgi:hypothetical protein
MKLCLLLLISSSIAFADQSKIKVHIQKDDDTARAIFDNNENYSVESFKEKRANRLPPTWKRNFTFQKAGLLPALRKKDHLYMDLLYLDALSYDKKLLLSKYAELPKDKLIKLTEIIRE